MDVLWFSAEVRTPESPTRNVPGTRVRKCGQINSEFGIFFRHASHSEIGNLLLMVEDGNYRNKGVSFERANLFLSLVKVVACYADQDVVVTQV